MSNNILAQCLPDSGHGPNWLINCDCRENTGYNNCLSNCKPGYEN